MIIKITVRNKIAMLAAVSDFDGAILTDENSKIILM